MRGICEAAATVGSRRGLDFGVREIVENDSDEEDLSRVMHDAMEQSAWGIASAIDVYDCDPATIRSASKIRRYVIQLCNLIGMKRFGNTMVVNFGEDESVAGYSMVQLIETSLISPHFADKTNTAYIDVFSCKPYDPRIVKNFSMRFFKGSRCLVKANLRL